MAQKETFRGTVVQDDDARSPTYYLEVPADVLEKLPAEPTDRCHVVLAEPEAQEQAPPSGGSDTTERSPPEPPVEEGEIIDVEIESLGDEGDGVAKVQGGYTVFVPDGDVGEQLIVEIETVKPRFAFATVRGH